ncbi:MAG: hypothetical protein QM658_03455 [Gordonia sp. (in: high G+C Gram-positive bacteria)]
MTDDDKEENMQRITLSVSEDDYGRLRGAALAARAPASVVGRALVRHGLSNITDPAIAGAIAEAAEAERARRSAAGTKGGVIASERRAQTQGADQ